jgi:hypothetical protein
MQRKDFIALSDFDYSIVATAAAAVDECGDREQLK